MEHICILQCFPMYILERNMFVDFVMALYFEVIMLKEKVGDSNLSRVWAMEGWG